MKKLFNKLLSKLHLTSALLLIYSVVDSLAFENKIGLISLIVLGIYFLINIRFKYPHQSSFTVALFLVALAVTLYVLDTTETLSVPIRKLSEWSYLLLILGMTQLLLPSLNEKKDNN